VEADDIIQKTEFPFLSVLPSHIRLVGAEIELIDTEDRESVLRKCIDTVRDRFDFIVIDCPPSLGLLTVNGLTSADGFLVPMQAEYFALEGLTQLLQTVRTVQKRLNTDLKMDGVVLTMFDHRLNLANQVKDELHKFFPAHIFETIIKRNVRLAEAPSFGKPVMNFAASSQGARDYLALASELISRKKRDVQY
ncbi:MAG: AAA family ATPase, partial [Calditrichaeota bacterium]|nr:AAA family ATPase [Calditrichota bacterium]